MKITKQDKVDSLNSAELLEYSKALRGQKEEIGVNVYEYLLKVINARREYLNEGNDKKVIDRDAKAIKKFIKEKR